MNEREIRRLIDGYLARLHRALAGVPGESRRELVEDVRVHIEEAWAAAPEHDRETLESILSRLGEPETLAQEERERLGLPTVIPAGGPDLLAVAAVVLTALLWPIGLLLAWLSAAWTAREKVIATLLPVLSLVLILAVSLRAYAAPVVSSSVALPTFGIPVGTILVVLAFFGAPFVSAIYLALRLRSRSQLGSSAGPLVAVVVALTVLMTVVLTPAIGGFVLFDSSQPHIEQAQQTIVNP